MSISRYDTNISRYTTSYFSRMSVANGMSIFLISDDSSSHYMTDLPT